MASDVMMKSANANNMEKWAEVCALVTTPEQAMVICQGEPYVTDVECQKFLGREYYERKDYDTSFKWFAMAAEQGDLECQKFLGREYYERKDYDTSFKWFAMAAEQGDLECQSFLGIEYYKRKDYTVALKWLFKAAEQNDSVSQKFLGWSYWSKNDNDNALKWYGKAAQQGDNEALFGVGIILLTKGDVTQAISYFQDAANKGFYRAAFWLGEIYFYGRGVQKDNQTALEWYARAADSGHIYAQRMVLRINYIRGAGISKIICCIKAIFLGVKFFVIAMKDRHDPRLGDIPGWGDFWIKR